MPCCIVSAYHLQNDETADMENRVAGAEGRCAGGWSEVSMIAGRCHKVPRFTHGLVSVGPGRYVELMQHE